MDTYDSVYFCEGNCYVSLYRLCEPVSKCYSLTKLNPITALFDVKPEWLYPSYCEVQLSWVMQMHANRRRF